MMMLKVIARTIGLHHLVLLNFYPYLQRYVQPHQRDVTTLLAAAVQACHDMVPPDAVEPLFKQIVNQFVHDKSRPEAIAVGLNVVREICMRMPLVGALIFLDTLTCTLYAMLLAIHPLRHWIP
jgi:protein SDA1